MHLHLFACGLPVLRQCITSWVDSLTPEDFGSANKASLLFLGGSKTQEERTRYLDLKFRSYLGPSAFLEVESTVFYLFAGRLHKLLSSPGMFSLDLLAGHMKTLGA